MSSSFTPVLCLSVFALAFILYSTPGDAQADLAADCCLTVSNKPIPKFILLSYRMQIKGDGCALNAVVFQTRKFLKFCAPPEEDWVKETITFLDNRLKKCKSTKYYAKRCQGLKTK